MTPNKNIFIRPFLVVCLVIFGFLSCDEDSILEEVPLDTLTTANLYSSISELELAVHGLHDRTRDRFFYDGNAMMTVLVGGNGADLSYNGENPAGSGFLTDYPSQLVPANDARVRRYWERGFEIIQMANVLLDAIEDIEPGNENFAGEEEQLAIIEGEGRFFRAFMYRTLVAMHGGLPIFEDAVASPRTDLVRASEQETYNFIISDLEFAANNLPIPGEERAQGRITRGAARHLLAEVYNTVGRYDEAIAMATSVINDFGYALMLDRFGSRFNDNDPVLQDTTDSRGDVFNDLFLFGNHNLPENTEDIWVIQSEPITLVNTIDGRHPGERAFGPAYHRLGTGPDGIRAIKGPNFDLFMPQFGRPVAWAKLTNYAAYDIWNSDWNNDIRNSNHNIFRTWRYNNPESKWFGRLIRPAVDWYERQDNADPDSPLVLDASGNPINRKSDATIRNDTIQYLWPYYMKIASPNQHFSQLNREGGGFSNNDHYAFRLSETYLHRAESHWRKGDLANAAADINVVRERAGATPVLPANVNLDYLLDERVRELYGEEWRLVTLMRLREVDGVNVYVERTRRFYDNDQAIGGAGAGIQDHNRLWPIPQSEIDLNIDATLEQNPGYN